MGVGSHAVPMVDDGGEPEPRHEALDNLAASGPDVQGAGPVQCVLLDDRFVVPGRWRARIIERGKIPAAELSHGARMPGEGRLLRLTGAALAVGSWPEAIRQPERSRTNEGVGDGNGYAPPDGADQLIREASVRWRATICSSRRGVAPSGTQIRGLTTPSSARRPHRQSHYLVLSGRLECVKRRRSQCRRPLG